jgi:hypothetical protein
MWFVFIGHRAPSNDGRDDLLVGADADRSAQGIHQRSVPRSGEVRARLRRRRRRAGRSSILLGRRA